MICYRTAGFGKGKGKGKKDGAKQKGDGKGKGKGNGWISQTGKQGGWSSTWGSGGGWKTPVQGYCSKPWCRGWGHKAVECWTKKPDGWTGNKMDIGAVQPGTDGNKNQRPKAIQDGAVEWIFEVSAEDDNSPFYQELDREDVCGLCVDEQKGFMCCAATGMCTWCLNPLCVKHYQEHLPCYPKDDNEEDAQAEQQEKKEQSDRQPPLAGSSDSDGPPPLVSDSSEVSADSEATKVRKRTDIARKLEILEERKQAKKQQVAEQKAVEAKEESSDDEDDSSGMDEEEFLKAVAYQVN